MSDPINTTTNIMDLPMDPANGGTNMNLIANEVISQSTQNAQNVQNNSSVNLDQNTINQIVNGLQQATASGSTQLRSRDIPMTTSNLTSDMGITPNFIPQPTRNNDENDYIRNYQETEDIINEYNSGIEQKNSLDDIYNEIQVPIL